MKPFFKYIVATALCLSTAHGYAQPFFGGGGERWHEHRKEMKEEFKKKMEELNLTSGQKEQLKTLSEQREKLHEKRKALWDERRNLMDSMSDKSISDEQLLKRFRDISSEQAALQEESFKGFLARRAILTPEQFSKMAAFWKEKRESFMKKHSRED